ncbi:hypothetical protein MD484_g5498, partial [Candolleomyces efflorescens]
MHEPAQSQTQSSASSSRSMAMLSFTSRYIAVNAGERPAVQMPDEYFPPNKILFMQNLPESATKDQLTLLFSQYPNLHDVRLIPQKKIKKANCNILLIQQSILRDAVDEIALNFLKRLNILVVKDVERDEISFLSKSPGCKPIADIEAFTADKLGYADLVEEREDNDVKVVRITGVKHRGRTVSIFAMGSKNLVVEESERFLHDALCVVRCLVEKRALIGVGGAPEIHVPAWFLSTPS